MLKNLEREDAMASEEEGVNNSGIENTLCKVDENWDDSANPGMVVIG